MALSLGTLLIGYRLEGRLGLFIALCFVVGVHLLLFFFGESGVIQELHGKPVLGQDPWHLGERVAKISLEFGTNTPQIYLIPSLSGLALSLSRPFRSSQLGISQGTLEKLSEAEVDAVLTYLMAHIEQLETFRYGLISGLLRFLLGFCRFLDALLPQNLFRKIKKQTPFLNFVTPLSQMLLTLFIPKQSFYLKDSLTAQQTQSHRTLAEALWKLEGLAQSRPFTPPPGSAHHFIVNPEPRSKKFFNFYIQPPTPLRLRRLLGTDTI